MHKDIINKGLQGNSAIWSRNENKPSFLFVTEVKLKWFWSLQIQKAVISVHVY